MDKRPAAVIRAEKLRAIMAMPEYAQLIGAWIKELEAKYLHDLTCAREPHEFLPAQGSFRAVQDLKDRFDLVFQTEKQVLEQTKQ